MPTPTNNQNSTVKQIPRRQPDPSALQVEEPEPLLTARSALILLTAAVLAMVVGTLTYFSAGNTAAAVLAGLTAGGASLLGLPKLIGR